MTSSYGYYIVRIRKEDEPKLLVPTVYKEAGLTKIFHLLGSRTIFYDHQEAVAAYEKIHVWPVTTIVYKDLIRFSWDSTNQYQGDYAIIKWWQLLIHSQGSISV